MIALVLLLGGCAEPLSGSVVGDAPPGATVALLWPGAGIGEVGGLGEITGKGFDLSVHQPEDNHPGDYLGTLVLYDGELSRGDVLTEDDLPDLLGAAPRHTIVDSNSTCSGFECKKDDTFERGIQCGVCDYDGCGPTACGKVELVVGNPLSLDWRWPGVDPREGAWTEDGRVIAIREPTVEVFLPGEPSASVFRDDDAIVSVQGVHVGAERVAVQVEDGVGKVRGLVRNFQGAPLLDLREEGNALVHGPVLSPDAAFVATAWADGSVRIHDATTGAELSETPVSGATAVHWAPTSDLVYALSAVGELPTAVPVLVAGAGAGALDPDGLTGDALGQPIWIESACTGTRYEDLPRSVTAVPTRICAPAGTTAG